MSALRSMTGFGAASGGGEGYSLKLEIRSVNHRHLLVKSRLGGDFLFLERDVEGRVRKQLERGSIALTLTVQRTALAERAALDEDALVRYRDQLARLSERLELEGGVTLQSLLALPGVVLASNGVPEPEALSDSVLALVEQALAKLIEMRTVEGRALASISESDMAREISLLCDRLDVAEELSRLHSHLAQLDAFLEQGGVIGRKLDFLVQEIFREVNTVGSKCADAQVAHWVVEAKTLTERLREQVQNVE